MSVARGVVAPGFEPVAHAFERNFAERGEIGAAFAATHRGELVVDLWGGLADRAEQRPWREDTLQLVFSGTKGLVAICLLLLIERGELELNAPVARSWPEFAAAGKEAVTVGQLVSHTARLPGLASPVTVEDVVDDRRMAALLAAQPPFADPRAARLYHPLTFGWLCGELVRRVDGRSVGRFLAEEVATPLGLAGDLHLGLPESFEPRVARIEVLDGEGGNSPFQELIERDELVRAVWANPVLDVGAWNSRAMHAAEIPGANAIVTARAFATLYGSLEHLLSPQTLLLGRTELERRREPVLDGPQRFGVGFMLQTEERLLGPPDDAFGHTGAGGSAHGAWPTEQVGFSYAMNLARHDELDGSRAGALLDALHGCVVAQPTSAGR